MSCAPVSPPSGPAARQYLDEADRLLATLEPLAKGRFAEASLVMAEPSRSRDGWRYLTAKLSFMPSEIYVD